MAKKPCRGLKLNKQVAMLAHQLHRCPVGYRGPCWGATQSDICSAQAKIDIAAIRASKNRRPK